ncbi:MAG: hypothetical protein AABW85_05875 [archaeon]
MPLKANKRKPPIIKTLLKYHDLPADEIYRLLLDMGFNPNPRSVTTARRQLEMAGKISAADKEKGLQVAISRLLEHYEKNPDTDPVKAAKELGIGKKFAINFSRLNAVFRRTRETIKLIKTHPGQNDKEIAKITGQREETVAYARKFIAMQRQKQKKPHN